MWEGREKDRVTERVSREEVNNCEMKTISKETERETNIHAKVTYMIG